MTGYYQLQPLKPEQTTQGKINRTFTEANKRAKELSKTPDEYLDNLSKNFMFYVLLTGGNVVCTISKNLFNKYIEEPRQQLKNLTIQNSIMIHNQQEFLRLMRELKQKSDTNGK